jgi:hypothetical protein
MRSLRRICLCRRVGLRSGQVSRSAVYLASDRPVVTQQTGFDAWLTAPVGGLIAFNTPEEALDGITEVNRRYGFHCRAAREVACEFFDSRKVLTSLVERALDSDVAEGAHSNSRE